MKRLSRIPVMLSGLLALLLSLTSPSFGDSLPQNGWYEGAAGRYYCVNGEILRSAVVNLGTETQKIWYCFQADGRMLDHDEEYMLLDANGEEMWFRAMEGGELYVEDWASFQISYDTWDRYYYGEMGIAASGPTNVDGVLYLFNVRGRLLLNEQCVIGDELWESDDYGVLQIAKEQPGSSDGDSTGGSDTGNNNTSGNTGGDSGDGGSGSNNGSTDPETRDSTGTGTGDNSGENNTDGSGTGDGGTENNTGGSGAEGNSDDDTGGSETGDQTGGTPVGGDTGTGTGEQTGGNSGSTVTVKNGWYEDENGRLLFYVNDVLLRGGPWEIGEARYWFREDGTLLTGGTAAVADADGNPRTVRARADGTLYCAQFYLDPETGAEYYYGADCLSASGFLNLSGKLNYFFPDGRRAVNLSFRYAGETWYADSDGTVIQIQSVASSQGQESLPAGTLVLSGSMLFRWTEDGVPERILADGLYREGYGFCCVLLRDGLIVRNSREQIEGKVYYFGPDGDALRACNAAIGGQRFLFRENGTMILGGWVNRGEEQIYAADPGHQYYADIDGHLLLGLCPIRDGYCLFDEEGRLLFGLNRLNGVYHLSDEHGRYLGVLQAGWNEFDGERYYLAGDRLAAGQRYYIEGAYRWFDESGRMLHDCLCGEIQMDSDGAIIASGWVERPEGKYFVLQETAEIVRGQEISIDNSLYYFGEDGIMVTGDVTVDGELRRYGEDGIRVSITEDGSGTEEAGNGEADGGDRDPDADYVPTNEIDTAAASQILYPEGFTSGAYYRTASTGFGSGVSVGSSSTAGTADASGSAERAEPAETKELSEPANTNRQVTLQKPELAPGAYVWQYGSWVRIQAGPQVLQFTGNGPYVLARRNGEPLRNTLIVDQNRTYYFDEQGRGMHTMLLSLHGSRLWLRDPYRLIGRTLHFLL